MDGYSTIVFIDRDIYAKIELYRQFLEKAELGTALEKTIFISTDSAEEIPSAGLAHAENCLYLYGLISKNEYVERYNAIEELRKEYQNPNFYMLFCRENYPVDGEYNMSKSSKGVVKSCFSIGIIEEDDMKLDKSIDGEDADELRDDLRCIKLLSLAMAICKYNQGTGTAHMKTYYESANIDVDYKRVYYAVIYELNKYAEQITKMKSRIAANKKSIEALKAKAPQKCEGHFGNGADFSEADMLEEFSKYKSMEELRRDMEIKHAKADATVRKDITDKIRIARYALAEAEAKASLTYTSHSKNPLDVAIVEDAGSLEYMSVYNADEKDIPTSGDLLTRGTRGEGVDAAKEFDAVKLHSVIPLANEFESSEKPSFGKLMLTTLCGMGLFALCVASVYLARYLRWGALQGVDAYDVMKVTLLPVGLLLAGGIAGLIVMLIRYLISRSVFKRLHAALSDFIASRKDMCENIKNYINKYLTVYYNYHLKYSRIEKLEEDNVQLGKDIDRIQKQAAPFNAFAQKICILAGENIPVPEMEVEKNNRVIRTVTMIIEDEIKAAETEFGDLTRTPRMGIAWLKRLAIGIGNVDGGKE